MTKVTVRVPEYAVPLWEQLQQSKVRMPIWEAKIALDARWLVDHQLAVWEPVSEHSIFGNLCLVQQEIVGV